jgi:hypothetical protein
VLQKRNGRSERNENGREGKCEIKTRKEKKKERAQEDRKGELK